MQLSEPLARWLDVYYKGVVQQTAVRVEFLVSVQPERKKGCVIAENVWWSSRDSPKCTCQSLTRPVIAVGCQVTLSVHVGFPVAVSWQVDADAKLFEENFN